MIEFNRFKKDTRGVLAIEMALMAFFVFSIFWITSEVCSYFLMKNKVQRATSSVAEMVANLNVPKETYGQAYYDELSKNSATALQLLTNMIVKEGTIAPLVGMNVYYYDLIDQVGEYPVGGVPVAVSYGSLQCIPTIQESPSFNLQKEQIKSLSSGADLQLVKVEACFQNTSSTFSFMDIIIPTRFEANYISFRKNN